jgi:hypothetical protein
MELKDMILSTLAELEESVEETKEKDANPIQEEPKQTPENVVTEVESSEVQPVSDVKFLQNVRERILVLFEGFQSPNNQNIEAKIDLTLNFLEYLLAAIDEQLEKKENPS